MLGQVFKKYQNYKKNNQKNSEILKQKIDQQIQAMTIHALKIQNHKVSKIHSNQQQIQNRLKRNTQLQSQLKIHLGGWIMLYQQLNKTLKQAGDIVNYAKYVQEQMKQMNQQLKIKVKEISLQTNVQHIIINNQFKQPIKVQQQSLQSQQKSKMQKVQEKKTEDESSQNTKVQQS